MHTFYTNVNGKRADIGVRREGGRVWVQTYADREWNNNLLALNECTTVFA